MCLLPKNCLKERFFSGNFWVWLDTIVLGCGIRRADQYEQWIHVAKGVCDRVVSERDRQESGQSKPCRAGDRLDEVADPRRLDRHALRIERGVVAVIELQRLVMLPLVVAVVLPRQFGGLRGVVGFNLGDIVGVRVDATEDGEGGHGRAPGPRLSDPFP